MCNHQTAPLRQDSNTKCSSERDYFLILYHLARSSKGTPNTGEVFRNTWLVEFWNLCCLTGCCRKYKRGVDSLKSSEAKDAGTMREKSWPIAILKLMPSPLLGPTSLSTLHVSPFIHNLFCHILDDLLAKSKHIP